jgi:hypothetical protein
MASGEAHRMGLQKSKGGGGQAIPAPHLYGGGNEMSQEPKRDLLKDVLAGVVLVVMVLVFVSACYGLLNMASNTRDRFIDEVLLPIEKERRGWSW